MVFIFYCECILYEFSVLFVFFLICSLAIIWSCYYATIVFKSFFRVILNQIFRGNSKENENQLNFSS